MCFMDVEILVPFMSVVDVSGVKKDSCTGYWGNNIQEVFCCPEPFYTLVVSPAGMVLPCCEIGDGLNLGMISKTNSIIDIWNGEKLHAVRNMMINDGKNAHSPCRKCGVVKYQIADEDVLDSHIDKLKEMYK